jgi:hypothetical protein
MRGSNFGIITFISQRDVGVSIERELWPWVELWSLGPQLAQETGFFVQTAFKSKANNGNEFVPLVYSSFRSYLTLELKLPIGEVYRNRKLTFQIQPLFDVSDIIPVVESNLGLPNILRDVVVCFTTLDL